MDRVRSALTGVNILIALASLALVLIVISRIPRVRTFLASVMPKRPFVKPLLKKKPERDREHRERPPVSDTDSDEDIERLEREAICRARPVIVPLMRQNPAAVIEEIETDNASDTDADAPEAAARDTAGPTASVAQTETDAPEAPSETETAGPAEPVPPPVAPPPVTQGRRKRAVK